ncbi:MAG: hypothetical protein AAGE52_15090 [Myxococcota bacterium]
MWRRLAVAFLLVGCASDTRVVAVEQEIFCEEPATLVLTANNGSSLEAIARAERGWGVWFSNGREQQYALVSANFTIEAGPFRVGETGTFENLEASRTEGGFFLTFGRRVDEQARGVWGIVEPSEGPLSGERFIADEGINFPLRGAHQQTSTSTRYVIYRSNGMHTIVEVGEGREVVRWVGESNRRIVALRQWNDRLWLLHARSGTFGVSRFVIAANGAVDYDGEALEPTDAELADLEVANDGVALWTIRGSVLDAQNLAGAVITPRTLTLREVPLRFDADLDARGNTAVAVADDRGLLMFFADEEPQPVPVTDAVQSVMVRSFETGAVIAVRQPSPFRVSLFRACRRL